MQGAWGPGATTAGPIGPYGHLCDAWEYKTITSIGVMSDCDIRPYWLWRPKRDPEDPQWSVWEPGYPSYADAHPQVPDSLLCKFDPGAWT